MLPLTHPTWIPIAGSTGPRLPPAVRRKSRPHLAEVSIPLRLSQNKRSDSYTCLPVFSSKERLWIAGCSAHPTPTILLIGCHCCHHGCCSAYLSPVDQPALFTVGCICDICLRLRPVLMACPDRPCHRPEPNWTNSLSFIMI